MEKDTPASPGNADFSPGGPFREVTDSVPNSSGATWKPPIDIGETPLAYVLVAELPGVRSEHLNLIYDHAHLTLEAQAPDAGVKEWQTVIREERDRGCCFRVFTLPKNVDLERRREKLSQGLLTIHLPKQGSAAVPLDPENALEARSDRKLQPLRSRGKRDLTEAAPERKETDAEPSA